MKTKMGKTGMFFLIMVLLYLTIPLITTLIYSFTLNWISILPRGFTLKYYIQILSDKRFILAVIRSVAISIIPVCMTSLFVILALYTALVYSPKLERVLEMISMVPYTINGVVLATAVLATYAGTGTIFANRFVMLISIYCVGGLPITFRAIRNNMYAVNIKQLIDAAEILGAGRLYAFGRIVVPCMVSGIMVSMLMCMAGIFGDYATVRIIAGSIYETTQLYLFATRNQPIQISSAVLVVMIIITLSVALSALYIQMKDQDRSSKHQEADIGE
ncbi:MAG: ABC transporter permease subunit [Treponema sp.]|nr:ABC transporter permease subunit [Treponema sp.]